MSRDFTLAAYRSLLNSALSAGYATSTVGDWLDGDKGTARPVMVLRHDVDRRPSNALNMATVESELGIKATYFFRVFPSIFDEAIVRRICGLGHEIGYHYEDFFLAGYDPTKALELFERNLAHMRSVVPIKSIAMHGSPLAKFNNMDIWKYRNFDAYSVKDCILSEDWSAFVFFTDTGRSFNSGLTNLRDYIGGQRTTGVKTSSDISQYLRKMRPEKVHLNIHPERWNDQGWLWTRQLIVDTAANAAKVALRTAWSIRARAKLR